MLRDGDVIATGYDAELDELRRIATHTDEFLLELERRERDRSGLSSLKLAYNRVSGFYIEVSRSQADNVPKDYIRRQTVKNAERFITPELKSFEDKVLGAREKSLAREREIYETVLTQLTDRLAALQGTAGALAALDTLSALAERAAQLGWTEPQLVAETRLEIRGGRHPVVEHFIDGPFVPNDLMFDASRRMLIVTGPNMGGKSTYMRQNALIALLAHVGSFVPADRAVLGPLDRIFTRIGAGDDLAGGRSTFMVEMTEAANILHNATDKSLILMDEIGRGTSTFDGLSLAWAVARHIARVNRSYHLVCDSLLRAHQSRRRGRRLRQRASRRHRTSRRHRVPARRQGRPREPQLWPRRGAARRRAARSGGRRARIPRCAGKGRECAWRSAAATIRARAGAPLRRTHRRPNYRSNRPRRPRPIRGCWSSRRRCEPSAPTTSRRARRSTWSTSCAPCSAESHQSRNSRQIRLVRLPDRSGSPATLGGSEE